MLFIVIKKDVNKKRAESINRQHNKLLKFWWSGKATFCIDGKSEEEFGYFFRKHLPRGRLFFEIKMYRG